MMRFFLLMTLLNRAQAGYRAKTLDNLLDSIKSAFSFSFSSPPLDFLEFGNQEIHDLHSNSTRSILSRYGYDPDSSGNNQSVKPFFTHLGLKYLSVDKNGLDGAISIDVRQDLTKRIHGKFDVITNVGFSEHINEFDTEDTVLLNQYIFFKSLHELGNVGALYFHDLPKLGSWFQHGMCNYETSFFRSLAAANEYELILLIDSDHLAATLFSKLQQISVMATYRKVDYRPFMSLREFSALPGIGSVYREYNSLMLRIASVSGEQTLHQIPNVIEDPDKILTLAAVEICTGAELASSGAEAGDNDAAAPSQWCVDTAVKALKSRWNDVRRKAGDKISEVPEEGPLSSQ